MTSQYKQAEVIKYLHQRRRTVAILISERIMPFNGRTMFIRICTGYHSCCIKVIDQIPNEERELLLEILRHRLVARNGREACRILFQTLGCSPVQIFCINTARRVLYNGRRDPGVSASVLGAARSFSRWEAEGRNEVESLEDQKEQLWVQLVKERMHRVAIMEMSLIPCFVEQEEIGFLLDRQRLQIFNQDLTRSMESIRHEVEAVCPGLNFNSRDHISRALSARGVCLSEVTKQALARSGDELAMLVCRNWDCKGLRDKVRELLAHADEYGCIHPQIDALKLTGRISTSKPNIHGLTKRGGIRECIIARPGKIFVSADLRQQEVRVLAALSGEEAIINACSEGRDFLREIAASILKVDSEGVTLKQREAAKTLVYAQIYGCGDSTLRNQLAGILSADLTIDEATQMKDSFFSTYPKVRAFVQSQQRLMFESENVETRMGRKRWFELSLDDRIQIFERIKELGRRKAECSDQGEFKELHRQEVPLRKERDGIARRFVNTAIQGGAADGVKRSMKCIRRRLPVGSRIALNWHDELIVECDEELKVQVVEIVDRGLRQSMNLIFPEVVFEVDIKTGRCLSD